MIREELIKYTISQQGVGDNTAEMVVDSYMSSKGISERLINKQVETLEASLEKTMKTFDSEADRMDFILDVCIAYKEELKSK